ncbi:MAG TPA: biotin/lipoyl-containing protein [Acidimicrobiales bacterium]|nr:biotin/lipoyl-containing protein [Acidimicrobiales bacterium]
MFELRNSEIQELVELVANRRIGALRVVAENGELVIGVDAAAVAELNRFGVPAALASSPVAVDPAGTVGSAVAPRVGNRDETAVDAASCSQETEAAPNGPRAGPQVEAPGDVVLAPLVGTFYSAPEPGAPPYVQVGDTVRPETTVGLIEAMKVFTAVLAGKAGRVKRVLVQNEEFVEFGQALIELEVA